MEISQVLMVSKESDGMGSSLELMSPMVEGTNDGKQLMIIDVVIPFGWDESLRKVHTGVKIAILVPLHEGSPAGKEGCISHDNEWAMDIRKMEHQGSLEFSQKGVKSSLGVRVPGPRLVLLC